MADNFLASPIIPGTDIKNHEHKRLVIALVVVIIIAIVIGIIFWTQKADLFTNENIADDSKAALRAQELDKAVVPLSPAELQSRTADLDKSTVIQSEARKAAIAEDLMKASQK